MIDGKVKCFIPTMALKIVKGNLERMFDKSLSDLVRGLRNNKDNEVSINKLIEWKKGLNGDWLFSYF